ncbi:MAG: hemolysin family protein [candidate division KSB1 bacterium]|nr:hemolysin family protein [candidate division KSB1 bacterium]MDZ7357340.1 hemolysin family protein [candidate division KSB1 bacterium]MDZ7399338.1 hemolysin family protein [candidate division KSB1 bacterium]
MEILFVILALLLSAFFSSSETAFLSASRLKIEVLHRRKIKGAKLVYNFIKQPESFIVTALIGNNFSNVLFTSLIVLILRGSVQDFMLVIISTGLLLIFAEIIPKVIAWEFANQLILSFGRLLYFYKIIFSPLSYLLIGLSNFLMRRFKISDEKSIPQILTRSDVQKYIYESEKYGIIESEEREIISRIFDLRTTRVKETMVPRTEIIAMSIESSIDDLIDKINETGVSRLPIYDKDIDNIVAVVYAKDLFFNPKELKEICEEILYVPETKSAFELLKEFQRQKISIAVVLDEYGGTAGLVTLEDLIEELFGEIYDEFDLDHEPMYIMEDERTIKVVGQAEVDELNEKFGLEIEEGDYTTIGGFITDKLGRIPHPGESIDTERYKIIVEKASRKRIILVKIILKNLNQTV